MFSFNFLKKILMAKLVKFKGKFTIDIHRNDDEPSVAVNVTIKPTAFKNKQEYMNVISLLEEVKHLNES